MVTMTRLVTLCDRASPQRSLCEPIFPQPFHDENSEGKRRLVPRGLAQDRARRRFTKHLNLRSR